jgi:hypothetical protein
MDQTKTYTGGCHCGKVRYEVTAELGKVVSCNCSMCSKKGHLLTFVAAEQFKLLSGEGSVSDYQFNKMNIHHLFCSTCGVSSFTYGTGAKGQKMYSVNARCLDDVSLDKLEIVSVDGKSR